MGRCGRNRVAENADNRNECDKDSYIILINLQDFVYMNERLYSPNNKKESNNTKRTITLEEDRNRQRRDLLDVLRSLVLVTECVHSSFEKHCSNPLTTSTHNF